MGRRTLFEQVGRSIAGLERISAGIPITRRSGTSRRPTGKGTLGDPQDAPRLRLSDRGLLPPST
eukprot:759435-Pyramimonas_sp.AAC.1